MLLITIKRENAEWLFLISATWCSGNTENKGVRVTDATIFRNPKI